MSFSADPPVPANSNTAVSYESALMAAGWSLIGQGAGGRVYHRNGDGCVIKVSEADLCYLAFATYAQSNPQTCLPTLTIVHHGNNWAVIHIEMLEPLNTINADRVLTWWSDYITARKNGLTLPAPTDWSALANALGLIASSGNCGFDMKSANAMQRGSTVVFTDPLF